MKLSYVNLLFDSLLQEITYGGHRGLFNFGLCTSGYGKTVFMCLGKLESKYNVNPNFEVINTKMDSINLLFKKTISSLFFILRTKQSRPLYTEVGYFFGKKFRKFVKENIKKYENPVIIYHFPGGYFSVLEEFDVPVKVYRAHNVEREYWLSVSKPRILEKIINEKIFKICEGRFAQKCDLVFAITNEDAKIFQEFYGVDKQKIVVIPHPVDTDNIKPLDIKEKIKMKQELGMDGRTIGVYIGGFDKKMGGERRVEEVRYLLHDVIPLFPEISFVFIGRVCKIVEEIGPKSTNVILAGILPEELKNKYLACADFALNPVTSGSGINIRMTEYLSYGLPVITTPIGARGFPTIADGKSAIIKPLREFSQGIRDLATNPEMREEIGKEGRKIIDNYFDKRIVGKKIHEVISKIYSKKSL